MIDPQAFLLDPTSVGLPSREELVEMRIWDNHYHGFSRQEEMDPLFERMGVERMLALGVPGRRGTPDERRQAKAEFLAKLETWKHKVSPVVVIDPSNPDQSVALIDEWVRQGPCVGIKYGGGNQGGINCAHPNNDPIIRAAAELGAVIYIHTWILVGGEPRTYAGGMKRGESTPMDVAVLAKRFPDVPLICGHSGGDWEIGIRAIREHPNVLFEFSGGDSWNGVGDMAFQELGADRLCWGSHAPTRAFATELSKLYASEMPKAAIKKALGTNLRRISQGIFARKGIKIEV